MYEFSLKNNFHSIHATNSLLFNITRNGGEVSPAPSSLSDGTLIELSNEGDGGIGGGCVKGSGISELEPCSPTSCVVTISSNISANSGSGGGDSSSLSHESKVGQNKRVEGDLGFEVSSDSAPTPTTTLPSTSGGDKEILQANGTPASPNIKVSENVGQNNVKVELFSNSSQEGSPPATKNVRTILPWLIIFTTASHVSSINNNPNDSLVSSSSSQPTTTSMAKKTEEVKSIELPPVFGAYAAALMKKNQVKVSNPDGKTLPGGKDSTGKPSSGTKSKSSTQGGDTAAAALVVGGSTPSNEHDQLGSSSITTSDENCKKGGNNNDKKVRLLRACLPHNSTIDLAIKFLVKLLVFVVPLLVLLLARRMVWNEDMFTIEHQQ